MLIIISIYIILCVEYNNIISDAGRNWCRFKIFVDGGIIIDLFFFPALLRAGARGFIRKQKT